MDSGRPGVMYILVQFQLGSLVIEIVVPALKWVLITNDYIADK